MWFRHINIDIPKSLVLRPSVTDAHKSELAASIGDGPGRVCLGPCREGLTRSAATHWRRCCHPPALPPCCLPPPPTFNPSRLTFDVGIGLSKLAGFGLKRRTTELTLLTKNDISVSPCLLRHLLPCFVDRNGLRCPHHDLTRYPNTEGSDPLSLTHVPLASLQAGAVIAGTDTVMPLLGTQISVLIEGGLAHVTTRRMFGNPSTRSIEACITLPVPTNAVVLGLRAEVDGRILVVVAKMKVVALDHYEQALAGGKTAVLHEELIRGIHRLSVGHVPPGKEVMVETIYAQILTYAGGPASLRIPVTVGDIYGHSPLAAAEDLVTSAAVVHQARFSVVCADGPVSLARGALSDGTADMVLDAPIDLTVAPWQPLGTLQGIAADGRAVILSVTPSEAATASIDAVLVLDGSGSMAEPVAAGALRTKHQAMIDGLVAAAQSLTTADRFLILEFGSDVRPQEPCDGKGLPAIVSRCRCDLGGTQIGNAIGAAVALASGRDILLVTDGKSYQLDPQLYTRYGRRISVVLIGEDALEAMVGHLAAVTGGSIFVAGANIDTAVATALLSLRAPYLVSPPIVGDPDTVVAQRSGMALSVKWGAPAGAAATGLIPARVVGAVAAALALPLLAPELAGAFAEAHGLVCHLTSLVLVDEAGERQEGMPRPCRVPLMTPAGAGSLLAMDCAFSQVSCEVACEYGGNEIEDCGEALASPAALPALTRPETWATDPNGLARGDLSSLPETIRDWVNQAAINADNRLVTLAATLGIAVETLLLGLLACFAGARDRTAARVAQAILAAADSDAVKTAMTALGLT